MNSYKYADLNIGVSESFFHIITETDMKRFVETTEDCNPLHTDEKFAIEHGFSSRVVYGLLTSSLISTLGGVYLPGKYCIIHQLEVKFVSPVFVGDKLEIIGTVKELNESVQQAIIKVEIKNQNGKKVVRGNLSVGFLEK